MILEAVWAKNTLVSPLLPDSICFSLRGFQLPVQSSFAYVFLLLFPLKKKKKRLPACHACGRKSGEAGCQKLTKFIKPMHVQFNPCPPSLYLLP